MTTISDIDIFVVQETDSPDWEAWSGEFAAMVSRWTGNDTRFLQMSPAEVSAGLAEHDPVLESIGMDAIPLHGSPSWLRHHGGSRRRSAS